MNKNRLSRYIRSVGMTMGIIFMSLTTLAQATPGAGPVVVAVNPTISNVDVGDTFDIWIEIRAGGLAVNGVQTYLNFDPAIVQVDALVSELPAGWAELQKTFDNVLGQVDFAGVTFSPSPMSTFNAVKIQMTALAESAGSVLVFGAVAPRETDVTTLDGGSVFDHAEGGTVVVTALSVPGVLQFSMAAYSINESGGSIDINVTRTVGSGGSVSVNCATSDGSATVGEDYTGVSETLTWLDSDADPKTCTVSIIDDADVESNETVILTLSNPTGGATLGPNNPAELTIVNDDVAVPNIGVNPGSLDAVQLVDTQTTQMLTINNSGNADLSWGIVETGATCVTPVDISWVSSISPANGITSPSGSSTVNIVFDSTGLVIGSYVGTLCINSNDPDTALVQVPVSLEVVENGGGPNDVVIDFENAGIFAWMNNAGWVDIHNKPPTKMVIGNIDGNIKDELIVDFPPYGIWILKNYDEWVPLHAQSADSVITTGDMDDNGSDEIIIDFGASYGIWVWMNDSNWIQLHSLSPEDMVTGDLGGSGKDEIIIDFGALYGIWIWVDNNIWFPLHSLSPDSMVTGDLDGNGVDDVVIDFGASYGIWVWMNNSTWSLRHGLSPESMVTGDMDGNGRDELIIDFGAPYGIWVWKNDNVWVPLHPVSPDNMVTGDVDSSGLDDVVISFGANYGIWVWMNDSSWFQLHGGVAEIMVIGNLDGLSSVMPPPRSATMELADKDQLFPESNVAVKLPAAEFAK